MFLTTVTICFMLFFMTLSFGHQEPFTSGNDYHCNPSFHVHPWWNINGSPAKQHASATCQPDAPPRDCSDIGDGSNLQSGQYIISPQDDGPPFRVFCDMETDGGSWTVIQRREDGAISFYRNWSEYENGFGNTNSEHWLGNQKIHRITSQAVYELRIDMADFDGNVSYAKYGKFRVGDNTADYKLILGSYSGNASDSLAYHNGAYFTTKDADHDTRSSENCAVTYQGAWWYKNCHRSNLNGLYLVDRHESFADGVNWEGWKGYNYSLKHVEMKIRRKN